MYRVPRFIRRFRRVMLFQDLMTGRRVLITTTDDEGNRHTSVEWVKFPIPPLAPGGTMGLNGDDFER